MFLKKKFRSYLWAGIVILSGTKPKDLISIYLVPYPYAKNQICILV
jgi:hypothetical protein